MVASNIAHICKVLKVSPLCFSSPQGLRFRSRSSLHAFLLENADWNLDINLFDFTASKVTDVSSVKQTKAKKKRSTEILDAPPSDRDSSSIRPAAEEAPAGTCQVEIIAVSEAEPAPGTKSPQRAESLREKLLKLLPAASQQNTLSAATDASQPPSAEPAAESENEGADDDEGGGGEEEEGEGKEVQIRRGGDDGSKSDGATVANGGCDVEEVLLPEVPAARGSQNSKNQFPLCNTTFHNSGTFFSPLFVNYFL